MSLKNVRDGLGVKKHVWFNFERNIWQVWNKNLTKEKTERYEVTDREIYKKYDRLSEATQE